MPLRGVRTPKLRVILECGLKWHSDCWSWSGRRDGVQYSTTLHSTGWSDQPECILSTPALQSAIHSGTPICTPLARLHLVWKEKFVVKIEVEDGLKCGVECSTPISTPIQLVEWSAVWSAPIRTPKIIVDWSADCTPKNLVDWSADCTPKKSECPKPCICPKPKISVMLNHCGDVCFIKSMISRCKIYLFFLSISPSWVKLTLFAQAFSSPSYFSSLHASSSFSSLELTS